jgi:oligosaccharide repeat unit polymerase
VIELCLLVLCVLAARLYERTWVNAPVILTASLLGPVLFFDFRLSGFTHVVLIMAAFCFSAAYYAVVIQGRVREAAGLVPKHVDGVCYDGVNRVVLLLFALGQAGFLINLWRVHSTLGLGAYIGSSAKDIEVVFGANTAVNYIFFLNMVAAAMAAFLLASRCGRWWILPVLMWAVLCLGFTGIKSTLIFGACITIFVYTVVRQVTIARLALSAVVLLGTALVLFAVVNVGTGAVMEAASFESVLERVLWSARGYVYNNYVNLDLELTLRSNYTYGEFTFFFVSKLLDPQISGYFDTDDFIVLDKDYNMGTLIREYFVDFGVPGALLIPTSLGVVTALIANQWRRRRRLGHAIALGVLWTACAFAFFGNQFVRLQFIYVVLVAYLLDAWMSARGKVASEAAAPTSVREAQ